MSTVQQLENTVRQLSAEELAAFRSWFAEFDAAEWDRQFEAMYQPGVQGIYIAAAAGEAILESPYAAVETVRCRLSLTTRRGKE